MEDLGGFQCVCPAGFEGPRCEANTDDCSTSPCLNGGTCMDDVNNFKCRCPPGFAGTLCQENLDDCLVRPCANGGTCFDLVGDFRCLCRPGFKGKDCSVDVDECAAQPCRNGAQCRDLVDDFICRCPACWTGKNCDIPDGDCAWPAATAFPHLQPHHQSHPHPAPASSAETERLATITLALIIVFGVVFVSSLLGLAALCLLRLRRRRPAAAPDAKADNERNAARELAAGTAHIRNAVSSSDKGSPPSPALPFPKKQNNVEAAAALKAAALQPPTATVEPLKKPTPLATRMAAGGDLAGMAESPRKASAWSTHFHPPSSHSAPHPPDKLSPV